MIYSIVSMDDIFYKENAVRNDFRKIKGGILEISAVNGIKQISRLHSTNPYMYLDRRYYPYSKLNGGQ